MDVKKLDQLICAEIPGKVVMVKEGNGDIVETENPLHKLVEDTQLHGLCGHHNPNLSCMKNWFCKFGFPKEYALNTEFSDNGYPMYRRRSPENGGNTIFKFKNNKSYIYTNKDVVPYNKYLLYKYQSHVNLDYCQGIKHLNIT